VIQFLAFFVFLFYFSTSLKSLSLFLKRSYIFALVLLPIIFILVSIIHTPFFIKPTQEENDNLKILDSISSPYAVVGNFPERFYSKALICYGSIYYNLNSAGGWAAIQVSNKNLDKLNNLNKDFNNRDCKNIIKDMGILNIKELVTYGEDQCDLLQECNLKHKVNKGKLCLFVEHEM
jgi:hypothetical protein